MSWALHHNPFYNSYSLGQALVHQMFYPWCSAENLSLPVSATFLLFSSLDTAPTSYSLAEMGISLRGTSYCHVSELDNHGKGMNIHGLTKEWGLQNTDCN